MHLLTALFVWFFCDGLSVTAFSVTCNLARLHSLTTYCHSLDTRNTNQPKRRLRRYTKTVSQTLLSLSSDASSETRVSQSDQSETNAVTQSFRNNTKSINHLTRLLYPWRYLSARKRFKWITTAVVLLGTIVIRYGLRSYHRGSFVPPSLLVQDIQQVWHFIRNQPLIRYGILLLLSGKTYYDWRVVKRRQARDATSEWGRYAKYPNARARALFVVILCAAMDLVRTKLLRNSQALLQRSGERFTTGLLQLGPLYIKLGQIISCRPNLLPKEWITALERLQDQVPAKSGSEAWELALSAWPHEGTTVKSNGMTSTRFSSFNETFQDFDDVPLAAASLGQVHRAKLRDTGEEVAIKLQRPFLREMYDQDFALLTKIAASIDSFNAWSSNRSRSRKTTNTGRDSSASSLTNVGGIQQNWTEIFIDAETILYREIDYRDEAENAIRFCNDFGLGLGGRPVQAAANDQSGSPLPSAADWLRTPYVYANLSSELVLVSEFVPSIKITKSEKLQQAGITEADKEYLADCLGRAYLRQFCCNLFFSTDPHPGNLGVEVLNINATVPAERVRIVFYDFGQATTLRPTQGEGILEIIEAIVDMDVDRSVKSFEKMGVLQPDADLGLIRAKIADNYETGKVKANRKRLQKRGYKFKESVESKSNSTSRSNTTTTVGSGTQDAAVMKYFKVPAEYAFVARALSQLDGVGKSLDADFDFVSAAAPWIYEIKGAGRYVKEEILKWLGSIPSRLANFFPRQYRTRQEMESSKASKPQRRSNVRIS